MELRNYQKESIQYIYDYLRSEKGNVCLNLPTGSGKSIVIAELCRQALTNWPDTRILMLTSRKELIEQNSVKMLTLWPNAPLGIFSASMNKREIDRITFAGIQSVRNRAIEIGRRDLILIDECHEISAEETGAYRTLIGELIAINPHLRVLGFTATPYRLGHGMITDKPAIFDTLIEPVTIKKLIDDGYLARLKSKCTTYHQNISDVHKRGGEFIEAELQKAVDTEQDIYHAVNETIERAGDRKSWIFFCAGVDHARHVRDELLDRGINAACVTGNTPKNERDHILKEFILGSIRAVTNCDVLTTGFDHAEIDLVILLRPTMSPGLYMQMVGRGLRVKSHGGDCMVLDFAGNIEKHGPIISVQPPSKKGKGDGIAPSKICPECDEIVLMSARICPSCGHIFVSESKKYILSDADIMGEDKIKVMAVGSWMWSIQMSKKSGREMLLCRYYPEAIGAEPITEYFCVYHDGFAGIKGRKEIAKICDAVGFDLPPNDTKQLDRAKPPDMIKYVMDGKFPRVTERVWNEKIEKKEIVYLDTIPF
jgi:DNA repair protein RadD